MKRIWKRLRSQIGFWNEWLKDERIHDDVNQFLLGAPAFPALRNTVEVIWMRIWLVQRLPTGSQSTGNSASCPDESGANSRILGDGMLGEPGRSPNKESGIECNQSHATPTALLHVQNHWLQRISCSFIRHEKTKTWKAEVHKCLWITLRTSVSIESC